MPVTTSLGAVWDVCTLVACRLAMSTLRGCLQVLDAPQKRRRYSEPYRTTSFKKGSGLRGSSHKLCALLVVAALTALTGCQAVTDQRLTEHLFSTASLLDNVDSPLDIPVTDPDVEVVNFGGARVAVHPGEQLGEALWACTQVGHQLWYECPTCHYVELGGPGLCSFSTARRFPNTRVVLHPSSQRLVDVSAGLNELSRPVCVNCSLEASLGQGSAIVQVNLCGECTSQLATVLDLLGRDEVHALLVLLPDHAPVSAQRELPVLAQAALTYGFLPLWGGFDGRIAPDAQTLLSEVAPARAISLFFARRQAPPPDLHVFVNLWKRTNSSFNSVRRELCSYLLDTAFAYNLTVHLVGPAMPTLDYGNRTRTYQKSPILHQALARFHVKPTDVVMLLDPTDVLVQASSATVLQRYMEAGAPVFHVSSEVGCFPRDQINCSVYDDVHKASLRNKHINSGAYIGRAVVIAKYVRDVTGFLTGRASATSWFPSGCTHVTRDQAFLACPYLKGNRYGLSLDYASTFFYSAFRSVEFLSLKEQRWVYNSTGGTPCVVHCNGNTKQDLQDLHDAMLPASYSTSSQARFQLDGRWISYGKFCRL